MSDAQFSKDDIRKALRAIRVGDLDHKVLGVEITKWQADVFSLPGTMCEMTFEGAVGYIWEQYDMFRVSNVY